MFSVRIVLAALAFAAAAFPAALGQTPNRQSAPADVIFIGDHIITMDDVEATGVAVRGDRIAAVGASRDVLKLKGDGTRIVVLGERALTPGLIDAHGHVAIGARLINLVNVSSPPVGSARTIADIQKLLADEIARKNIPEGGWVIGYGYDESLLDEQRHPNRDDLDAVSTTRKIMLTHVSFHLATVNSAALAAYDIDAAAPDPAGGRIHRRAGSREPDGVLEEAAAQKIMFEQILANVGDFEENLQRTLRLYASYGITTAQDGGATMRDISAMRDAAAKAPLPIDLVAYPFVTALTPAEREGLAAEPYRNGFRVGGAKFVLDGSIQGKTGYLRAPYLIPPDGESADYRGYPAMPAAVFEKMLTPFIARGVPILAHANGDAAIDMMLDGIDAALASAPSPDHRSVIIHAQMMQDDQLDRAAKLGVIPSYFSAHTFFWGDWHRKILGEARASRISPIQTTVRKGLPFTVHNDSPVIPPDMMRLLWASVNRTTRSGYVLGADERATVMQALYAMTAGAAYQYFEEDEKGSITTGKRADLVILAADPRSAPPETLKDIAIVETIARGKTVYRASSETKR